MVAQWLREGMKTGRTVPPAVDSLRQGNLARVSEKSVVLLELNFRKGLGVIGP
jgi:hypothetical protein